MSRSSPRDDTASTGKINKMLAGIGRTLFRATRKLTEVTNKKLHIRVEDWEMDWNNPFTTQSAAIRPQCADYEYQFDIGALVKVAPGFYRGELKSGDVGVVMKRVVMYSPEVKSDGPAYKIAWQKEGNHPLHIREFMLVPVRKRSND